MSPRRVLAPLAALLCLLLPPGRGQAWGVIGHAMVADIAERHLTPAAIGQVRALLRDEGWEHLDQVASWPDTIRKERPEASPWHYVDIPLTADAYVPARDCRDGDCAVEAIKRFSAVLADRSQPAGRRREALKFLVHFVGDLHQPLHGTDNAGDHGGNRVPVSYFGQTTSGSYPLNLHWVWDTTILEHQLGVTEQPAGQPNAEAKAAAAIAANTLDARFPHGLPEAAIADPAVWAIESHDLAKAVVYPGVVAPGAAPPIQPVLLGEDYQRRAWPVVERRIELGGLRLAALLNRLLGP